MWVIIRQKNSNSPYVPNVVRWENQPSVVHESLTSAIKESERLANNNVGDTFVVYNLSVEGSSTAKKARYEPTSE